MNTHKLEILVQHLEGCLRDETFAIAQRNLSELECVFALKAEVLRGIDQIQEREGNIHSLFPHLAARLEKAQTQQQINAAEFDKWTEETRVELAEIRRAAVQLRDRLGPLGLQRNRSVSTLQLWG